MKEIKVTVKKYQCENCGATSQSCEIFTHCKICGKPICKKCGKEVEIYKPDWDDMIESYVCENCYQYEYDFWKPVYLAKAKELEEEYYKKLDNLTIEYLKSNDELMRRYNDKLKVNLY